MPYELVVDGLTADLGDRRYLLSPQDLAAVNEIPALIKAGVRSFKIEGSLKAPEYVAAVTAVYRRAIDRAVSGNPSSTPEEDWYALEMTFSRGLFSGWMHGVDHQKLVPARFGKKRGPCAGKVTRVGQGWVEIEQKIPLRPGDGVVFDQGGDPDDEQGGRLYSVRGRRIEFARGKVDFRRIRVGDIVWKTDDPQLNRELRRSWTGGRLPVQSQKKIPLLFSVQGSAGSPLSLKAITEMQTAEVLSRSSLTTADKAPLTPERLRGALDKLEETPFSWGGLDWLCGDNTFLPIGEINHMRRAVLEKLLEPPRAEAPAISVSEIISTAVEEVRARRQDDHCSEEPSLHVLCRDMEQARCAAEEGAQTLLLDFEDIRRYGPAVEELRAAGSPPVYLATPRIQKAGEEGFFKLIERSEPDGVLIRNPGALQFFQSRPLHMLADFSLNVANPLTAAEFLQRGCERVTISYDLTVEQILPLATCGLGPWLEITLHQHMPMFHMEHCVFAAFMSNGKDYTDCGRPCEKHRVHLRDRVGQEHPLRADVGCRNTLFRQAAQTGASFYDELLAAGLRHFRVELLEESAAETRKVLSSYRNLLAGRIAGSDLWQSLRAKNQLGVTTGTLAAHAASRTE
jgi:putative protease